MASFMNKIKSKVNGHKKDAQPETTTVPAEDFGNQNQQQQQQQPTDEPEQKDTTTTTEDQQPPEQTQTEQQPTEAKDNQPSSEDTSSDEDHENCLSTHNAARSAKGTSPLKWDSNLASDAQSYAQTLADKDTMEHAGVEGQGENLYMATTTGDDEVTFNQAVQSWLDEEKDYKGEKIGEGDNFMKWGHFSQCLWHSTTHVGMGKAKSKAGATYVVARYTPQGNMAGEKPF